MSEASRVPIDLVSLAADAAMSAVENTLEAGGAKLDRVFVTLSASSVPDGELDACTAAGGDAMPDDFGERSAELVAFLVTAAAETGKMIGLDIRVVPIGGQG